MSEARELVGPERIVGLSTHTPGPDRRRRAASTTSASGRSTRRRPSRAAPPSVSSSSATPPRHARVPFFAIGGIDRRQRGRVVAAGARRVAVVRALTDADDPEQAARELRAARHGAGRSALAQRSRKRGARERPTRGQRRGTHGRDEPAARGAPRNAKRRTTTGGTASRGAAATGAVRAPREGPAQPPAETRPLGRGSDRARRCATPRSGRAHPARAGRAAMADQGQRGDRRRPGRRQPGRRSLAGTKISRQAPRSRRDPRLLGADDDVRDRDVAAALLGRARLPWPCWRSSLHAVLAAADRGQQRRSALVVSRR